MAQAISGANRYYIQHNRAVIYFVRDEEDEYLVVLNANGTTGCQHNGVQECSAGCSHVEQAKLLEMLKEADTQKYYALQASRTARVAQNAPLNRRNEGFSLLR